MGFAASFFFGRRPLRKVFDGIQLWFAERHVASGKPMRWYLPPTFRARCNYVAAQVQAGTLIATYRPGTLQAGFFFVGPAPSPGFSRVLFSLPSLISPPVGPADPPVGS